MIKNRIVLFAINNPLKVDAAEGILHNYAIAFERVQGMYKGTLEDSYIAIANTDTKLEVIKRLAKAYKQESVLIVDENRHAILDYLNGETSKLPGLWHETGPEHALKLDAWTKSQRKYYTIS